MTDDEKFEYKSKVKLIRRQSDVLDVSIINGLECTWDCKVDNRGDKGVKDVLMYSWKFNWDELKKKGINRLFGFISVTSFNKVISDETDEDNEHYYCDISSHNVNVDLKQTNEVIECEIETFKMCDPYLGSFEYSLIANYIQIEEVNEHSSSVQNNSISVVEEDNNNTNEENLLSDSDKIFLPSEQNDAILVIAGRKVHVNKSFLSFHSEFFRNLFIMDCKDGKVNEIPIGGITFEEFKLLLAPISLKPVFPIDETVEKLLELATRYKVPFVIHQCEHQLLHMSKLGNEKKMLMAEKYGMTEILEKSIIEVDTLEKAKKWKKTPEYSMLSGDTKSRVLEKFI